MSGNTPKIKREVLEIKDWQAGVSSSPYSGISVLANLDVSKSGCLRMNNAPVASTSSIDGLGKHWAKYNGTFFTQTSTGKIYQSVDNCVTWTLLTGNTLNRASGNGLAVYHNKLFAAFETGVDVYDLVAGTWSNGYAGFLNIGAFNSVHTMVVGQDDILYIANGNVLASYNNTSWNNNCLDLPDGYSIVSLSEYGQMLMVGTVHSDQNRADIFPWDRVSSSFELPVRIGENGVYQLISKDNTCYAVCGDNYTVYNTNGTIATKVASLADYLRPVSAAFSPHFSPQTVTLNTSYRGLLDASSGNFPTTGGSGTGGTLTIGDMWQISVAGTLGATLVVNVGDIVKVVSSNPGKNPVNWTVIYSTSSIGSPVFYHDAAIGVFKEKILFGMNVRAVDTGDSGRYPFGIWSFDGAKWQVECMPSDGTINITTTGAEIGCIIPASDYSFAYTWKTANGSGIDVLSTRGYFSTGYTAPYESMLHRVGTLKNPYTFQSCEIEWGKPLTIGQGIRVKYRSSLTDSWTTLGTFDYATLGGVHSHYIPFAGQFDTLQVRIEFTTSGNDISCPELFVLRFT